jgi:hypothetical protein
LPSQFTIDARGLVGEPTIQVSEQKKKKKWIYWSN